MAEKCDLLVIKEMKKVPKEKRRVSFGEGIGIRVTAVRKGERSEKQI